MIEIVSHCWAVQLPHYAYALNYQLESLRQAYQQGIEVVSTVCYSVKDYRTLSVLNYYLENTTLPLRMIPLTPGRLGRRAIGRDVAARHTHSDVIWFSDVDQVYPVTTLQQLADLKWDPEVLMVYPKEIRICRDHSTGDRILEQGRNMPPPPIDCNLFVPKRYGRAIGGVQIVRGDTARACGYLGHDPRWMQPTKGDFVSCKCDLAYRSQIRSLGKIQGIDLPGVLRLRHSEKGRDVKMA